MKNMRRIAGLLLAIAMIFSLATTAFADNVKHDSITITNAKPGETYTLYKLFNLAVDSELEPSKYSYTVCDGWEAFFGEGGAGANYVTIENGYVTAITGSNTADPAADLAKAAAEWTGKPAAKDSETVAEGANTVTFDGLDNGYWLITSTLGTVAMTNTTPADKDVSFAEKNPENTIEKAVKEDSTDNYGETNDAQIGDTVEFKSTVTVYKNSRNVVVHDTMTSGLTLNANSIAVTGLTKDTHYTVDTNPDDDHAFDITFVMDQLAFGNDAYKTYEITYTAVLNANAVTTDIAVQTNTTYVSFGAGSESEEDSTTTTTHKFSVHKHAAGANDNLAGAVFSLKKGGVIVKLVMLDANNYRVAVSDTETGAQDTFITVENGDIVIWGVDADDDYTLEETDAPEGYNELEAEVEIEVKADNTLVQDVENKAGTVLPSTGGIGTTMFYVLGGLLVAAAIVLLVTKKRMSAE